MMLDAMQTASASSNARRTAHSTAKRNANAPCFAMDERTNERTYERLLLPWERILTLGNAREETRKIIEESEKR